MITRYAVFQKNREDFAPIPSGGISVRWHTKADIDVIARFDVGHAYINRRLAAGARIGIAEIDGAPAGWMFFEGGRCDQADWLTFAMAPDMVCMYAAFTLPKYRGRHIPARLRAFCAHHWPDPGLQRFVWIAEITNAGSMRSAAQESAIERHDMIAVSFGRASIFRFGGRWRAGWWHSRRRCVLAFA